MDVENKRPSYTIDLTTGQWRIALYTALSQNGGWEQGDLTRVKKKAFPNTWSVFCCAILVIEGLLFSCPFVSHSLQSYTPHIVFHSEYLTGMCTLQCGRKRIQLFWRRNIYKENIYGFVFHDNFYGHGRSGYSSVLFLALPFWTEVVSSLRSNISVYLLL